MFARKGLQRQQFLRSAFVVSFPQKRRLRNPKRANTVRPYINDGRQVAAPTERCINKEWGALQKLSNVFYNPQQSVESVSNLMIMLKTFCIKGEKMSTKQSKLFQIKEAISRLFIRVFQFQENLLGITANQSFQSKTNLSKISTNKLWQYKGVFQRISTGSVKDDLLYCREAMFGASPIRQTTPLVCAKSADEHPSTEGKCFAFEKVKTATARRH